MALLQQLHWLLEKRQWSCLTWLIERINHVSFGKAVFPCERLSFS
jgi:hypothetical protein